MQFVILAGILSRGIKVNTSEDYIVLQLGLVLVIRFETLRDIFFTDSTLPEITFDANQPTVTLRFPRFSWTSSKPASFQCSLDGFVRDIQQCGTGTFSAWQRYKPDGDYTLSVRGRDSNGNTGSRTSHSFRVGKVSYTFSQRPSFLFV